MSEPAPFLFLWNKKQNLKLLILTDAYITAKFNLIMNKLKVTTSIYVFNSNPLKFNSKDNFIININNL